MSVCCPLCHSENVNETERIAVSSLARLYEKMLRESILKELAGYKEISFYHCKECDLKFFYPPVTGSEQFYEIFHKFDWYYLEEKSEYDFASQYISETDRVLEIGCGKGVFAKKIKASDYTGLEFSRKAKLMAEKSGVHIANESIQEHAKKNRQMYDVVCAFQVLEHVADVRGFLMSLIECLRTKGVLIISVPSVDSFLSSVTNGLLNMPPHHVTWWSDKSLKSLTEIVGLELLELEHETLSNIHKDWYSTSVVLNALNALFKRSPGLIDTTLMGKIITMLAWVLGKFYSLGIRDKNMRPYGHSVTAIYRKRELIQ